MARRMTAAGSIETRQRLRDLLARREFSVALAPKMDWPRYTNTRWRLAAMTDSRIRQTLRECAAKIRDIVQSRQYRVVEIRVCDMAENDGITIFGHGRNQCDVFSLDEESLFPIWETLDAAAQAELDEYRLRAGA